MQHNTQKNILPGQITQFRGEYYEAQKRMTSVPCRAQCDCRLPEYCDNKLNCSGFCYRWNNGDEIVFKKLDEVPSDECVIVETEFMSACREFNNCQAIKPGVDQKMAALEVQSLERQLKKAKAKLREMEYEKQLERPRKKKGEEDGTV